MIKNKFIKILIRFGIFTGILFVLLVTVTLTAAFSPNYYRYTEDSFDWEYSLDYNQTEFNIVFDHHSHTKYSDGHLTVEQNVLWHLAHGFNAMMISDHNTIANADEIADVAQKYAGQMIFIPGFEWTTSRIHLNLIGVDEIIPVKSNPTDEEIIAAINATHEQGGIVVVDHIPWSLPRMPNHPTRAQLLSWGVDYIELVNEDVYDIDSESWCNNTGGFGSITGTDMHHPMDVFGWTLMQADNLTTEGVMKELLTRDTTIIYNSTGSEDFSTGTKNPAFTILKPLIYTGNIFLSDGTAQGFVSWASVGIAYAYFSIGFVIFESVKFGITKVQERRKQTNSESKNEYNL